MLVKLIDRKSGNCVASGTINGIINRDSIASILQESRLFIDDFGNVKNLFGEFTRYNIDNLVPVYDNKAVV